MASFDPSELLTLVQTIAIIAALVATLYFSQRQIRALRVDLETRVLNDVDEKFHHIAEMFVERPDLNKIIYQGPSIGGPEIPAAAYILYFCAHIFHMRQRGILADNDWAGWLRWMQTAFRFGTLGSMWKAHAVEQWFDPAFREFVEHRLLESPAPSS
jgi:hypothetical protein